MNVSYKCKVRRRQAVHKKKKRTTVEAIKKGIKCESRMKMSCYFGFLLTGPTGAAINNLRLYLTWDPVPGGDILAGFDAERASSPPPLSNQSFSSLLKCLPWCYLHVGFSPVKLGNRANRYSPNFRPIFYQQSCSLWEMS